MVGEGAVFSFRGNGRNHCLAGQAGIWSGVTVIRKLEFGEWIDDVFLRGHFLPMENDRPTASEAVVRKAG
jgi:hypothetical protein